MKRLLFISIILIAPILAFAAGPAGDPCSQLNFNCDASSGDNIIRDLVKTTGLLLAGIAGGAAVLFAVIGGAQLLLGFGDESKITKGRNAVVYSLLGFALVLASQSITSFVIISASETGLHDIGANPFINVMNSIVRTMILALNSVFVIVMVATGIRMVISHGKSDDFSKARQAFIYALIGAFVINFARAFVNGILNTGFGGT